MKKNKSSNSRKGGLSFERKFTQPGKSPFESFEYVLRDSVICSPDGKVISELKNVEVPTGWSQVSTDILAQKYFRKTGIQGADNNIAENSVKQVVHRMVHCWQIWGDRNGYFDNNTSSEAFYDECVFMMLNQMCAPNSPQWFNTGLFDEYGLKGEAQGHFYTDPITGITKESQNVYEHPQPHACFILSVNDDLLNPGGIMDLLIREARIFKYGSGAGTNYSAIRGSEEKLSGGGYSSGLMSFLKIGDRAAGAIKSGGTTRRAARMVCLDVDHPEIESFVRWKSDEERKALALIKAGYGSDFEGEAYQSISGQNSNNSVRVTHDFMKAVLTNSTWELRARTDGSIVKIIKARDLWNDIAFAAWNCADPGLQFDSTINEWHTCPNSGKIRASNPCSEYMFLDNTACNLASINLLKFYEHTSGKFNTENFEHAVRIWTVVLEISVMMAQFPSKEVAENSYSFRTLGLGICNLGALLMSSGLAYDSDKGRALSAAIMSLLSGTSYFTSAEMASKLGAFKKYSINKKHMLRVIRNHRFASYNSSSACESLTMLPVGIEAKNCPAYLLKAACNSWDNALRLGKKYGFRNAQVSCIAPTGTIGLLMGCDTTGVEPDFSLIKFKKLSGGGYFKMINQSVEPALNKLGYNDDQITEMLEYMTTWGTLEGGPHITEEHLSIFDCANLCGEKGSRFISVSGHIKMMAAIQPFVSGGISKTINMPNQTTPEEIEKAYLEAWKSGLKSISIYRDGSKHSQPLSSAISQNNKSHTRNLAELTSEEVLEAAKKIVELSNDRIFIEQLNNIIVRKRLPSKRKGFTQKAKVGGHTLFVRTGEYSDGTLGEIFIDMHKEGASFRSLLNCFAIAVSIGLQYGVPLEEFADKFLFTRFEPSGPVDHPNIKNSTSVIDYIFRLLSFEYLNRVDLVQMPPEASSTIQEKTKSLHAHSLTTNTINHQLGKMMGDAPVCTTCGHLTIRSGTCYKCLNCGTSLGCS